MANMTTAQGLKLLAAMQAKRRRSRQPSNGHPQPAAPEPRRQPPRVLALRGAIFLTLPYPPSANTYWRTAVVRGRVRVYVSEVARRYKTMVCQACRAAGVRPTARPVTATLRQFRPQPDGDLDNRLKVTLDALEGAVYLDDEQVAQIFTDRREDPERPRVEITISPLEEGPL